MIPTHSNLNKSTCTPVSSNCVIWEGEDIPCIDLCKGDSISEVTYKLAEEICSIKGLLDLSDLDLSCLVEGESSKLIGNVLQLLITKVCTIEGLLPGEPGVTSETVVTIASCFVEDDENGDPITQLPISVYAQRIGIKLCALKTLVDGHTTLIEDHEDRITILEQTTPPSPTLPNIIPSCTFETNEARSMDVVLTQLERDFCEVKGVLGTPIQLAGSVNTQCVGLKDEQALSTSGTMGSIDGWVASPNTVAATLSNMWLTICDMRAVIRNVVDCCQPSCADIIVDFTVFVSEARDTLTLFFNGLTTIPGGYSDCNPAGSILTITDSAGHTFVTNVDITANKAVVEGIDIDLTGSTINTNLVYTITLEACLKSGDAQCNRTIVKTDIPPCGIATSVTASLI